MGADTTAPEGASSAQSPSSQHRPPPLSAQLSGDPAPSLSHAARAWPVRLERHVWMQGGGWSRRREEQVGPSPHPGEPIGATAGARTAELSWAARPSRPVTPHPRTSHSSGRVPFSLKALELGSIYLEQFGFCSESYSWYYVWQITYSLWISFIPTILRVKMTVLLTYRVYIKLLWWEL